VPVTGREVNGRGAVRGRRRTVGGEGRRERDATNKYIVIPNFRAFRPFSIILFTGYS